MQAELVLLRTTLTIEGNQWQVLAFSSATEQDIIDMGYTQKPMSNYDVLPRNRVTCSQSFHDHLDLVEKTVVLNVSFDIRFLFAADCLLLCSRKKHPTGSSSMISS